MLSEEILEGNKLIAEWLGYEIDSLAEDDEPTRYYVNDHLECIADGEDYWETFEEDWTSWLYPKQMKFHADWSWLMSVVEKIESIKDDYHGRFGVHIISNTCTIQATNFRPDKKIPDPPHYFNSITLDSKIESTWYAVVEFIKWYENDKRRNTSSNSYIRQISK